jgi:hypothetical protein
LYTSIIPNLLIPEIANAIKASNAPKFYICNVAMQPGETDNYTLNDHVQALEAHTAFVDNLLEHSGFHISQHATPAAAEEKNGYLFNFVLANNNLDYPIPEAMSHLQAVLPAPDDVDNVTGYQVIGADIVDEQYPWRHDSVKLAQQLMNSYKQISANL